MAIGFGTSMSMKNMRGEGHVDSIRLDLICPRHVNKYINEKDDFESLKDSIKESGLIQPIMVVEIEKFLNSPAAEKLSEKSLNYYKNQLSNGRKYFITVGHRRYYAYCSLCIGKDFMKKSQLPEFYEEYKNEVKKDQDAMMKDDIVNRNKYLSIKADISNDSYESEKEKYNASNLNQRAKRDFETIVNTLDDLEESGELKKLIEENKIIKINSMKERTIKDTINRISPNAQWKTIDDAKEILLETRAELFPGYLVSLNETIQQYISKKRHKKVSLASVNFTLSILNTYDDELIEMIFDGDFRYKNAIDLLPVYKLLTEKEKETVKQEIKDDKLNIGKWKAKKEKKKVKNTIDNKELLKMIKQVYSGKRTIEDVYEELKEKNLI